MPLESWMRTGSADFLREILLDPAQVLFDRGLIERLLDLQNRGYSNSNRLFMLAIASLWAQAYGMSRG